MKFCILVVAVLMLATVASAASNPIYVFPWNNYSFRGLSIPALSGNGPDMSGIQVLIVADDVPTDSLYLFRVDYRVGDEPRVSECTGRVLAGNAGCFFTLGKHDGDYKVTKITATLFLRAGTDVTLNLE